MTEQQFSEIERTLLGIDDARARTGRALDTMFRARADAHVQEALRAAERQLRATYRDLRIGTYFAVPEPPESKESAKCGPPAGPRR